MDIKLKKFGTILTSRQAGKEAYAAFLPFLNSAALDEDLIIDFEGVDVFSPSWGDEFLTPLKNKSGDKLFFKNIKNVSVRATLEILEEIHKYKFNVIG